MYLVCQRQYVKFVSKMQKIFAYMANAILKYSGNHNWDPNSYLYLQSDSSRAA